MVFCTSNWIEIACLNLCRGSYQTGLIVGESRWSGSDIRNRWGASYYRSRKSLVDRIKNAGFYTHERHVNGKVFMIVGVDAEDSDSVTDDELIYSWV